MERKGGNCQAREETDKRGGAQLFKTKISDVKKKLLALCWDKMGGAGPHQLRALGHNTDFI